MVKLKSQGFTSFVHGLKRYKHAMGRKDQIRLNCFSSKCRQADLHLFVQSMIRCSFGFNFLVTKSEVYTQNTIVFLCIASRLLPLIQSLYSDNFKKRRGTSVLTTFTTKSAESIKALAHHTRPGDTRSSILTAHAHTRMILPNHHVDINRSLS